MEIDLHTLRKASHQQAIKAALMHDYWAIIVSAGEGASISIEAAKRLIEFGKTVHFVCPKCAMNGEKILGQEVFSSIDSIDSEVEIICMNGNLDIWLTLSEIGQRMEYFGDVKAVWLGPNLGTVRWAEDAHDYGIAIVMGENILDVI